MHHVMACTLFILTGDSRDYYAVPIFRGLCSTAHWYSFFIHGSFVLGGI